MKDDSFNQFSFCISALIATVCGAITLVALIFVVKLLSTTLWTEEAAGWFQAIGSLIAIGVAIDLSRRQSRNAHATMVESDLRGLRRRLDSFRGILKSGVTQMKKIADELQGVTMRKSLGEPPSPANPENDRLYMTIALSHMQGQHPFTETLQIIDSIPFYDLGSAELVEAVRDFKFALQSFANHIQHALSEGEDHYSDTSLWNSASIWPGFAADAANRFDSSAQQLTQRNA